MALETLAAGRYSGAYNSVDVGITENGYEIQLDSKSENIAETDAFGQSAIDFIYRGGDVFLQWASKAYKAGSLSPFWPWATLGSMGLIGRLASDVAAAMVLSATSGTPAASAPATLTGTKAILAPNFPARLLFNSKVRNVETRLQLLPYDAGSGVIKWFV